jgi:hypothetical protein
MKCFELGMRKDWIMTEGEREEKRRKIQENRLKKKDSNGNSDNETLNLNDSNAGNSGNECSMNNNEHGTFTDDNNNSFGESNKNKPIRRRRRRRRHSQTEIQTSMDTSNPHTTSGNKPHSKSPKTTIIQNENEHNMTDPVFFSTNHHAITHTDNKNINYPNSINMLGSNQQQNPLVNNMKSSYSNSQANSMANLLKPNPYLSSINQIVLCNVSVYGSKIYF